MTDRPPDGLTDIRRRGISRSVNRPWWLGMTVRTPSQCTSAVDRSLFDAAIAAQLQVRIRQVAPPTARECQLCSAHLLMPIQTDTVACQLCGDSSYQDLGISVTKEYRFTTSFLTCNTSRQSCSLVLSLTSPYRTTSGTRISLL